MIPPSALKVVRGEPIEIELQFDEDMGSPAPTLTFTMATSRDALTKLYTAEFDSVDGQPTIYRVLLSPEVTNRALGKYWWDVWRQDIPQLLAIGSLDIQGVVRLP